MSTSLKWCTSAEHDAFAFWMTGQLRLVNTGWERSIDWVNCSLLQAAGAWGSPLPWPSKCHIAAFSWRTDVIFLPSWTQWALGLNGVETVYFLSGRPAGIRQNASLWQKKNKKKPWQLQNCWLCFIVACVDHFCFDQLLSLHPVLVWGSPVAYKKPSIIIFPPCSSTLIFKLEIRIRLIRDQTNQHGCLRMCYGTD